MLTNELAIAHAVSLDDGLRETEQQVKPIRSMRGHVRAHTPPLRNPSERDGEHTLANDRERNREAWRIIICEEQEKLVPICKLAITEELMHPSLGLEVEWRA